jgi:hypothetical protein
MGIDCTHPEIMSWHDHAFPCDWYFLCKSCEKRVKIPIMTICLEEDCKQSSHQGANHAIRQRCVDLFGQVFGEQWKEKMQREANEWGRYV